MATIDTASPTVSARDQNPPTGDDRTIAGELDLSQTPAWSFLSSFAFPGPDHFAITYDDADVSVDIGQGRVARTTNSGQRILTVGSVSGLALKGGTVNYIYFTNNDTIVSKDQDVPPSPESLLIGTVDPRDGTINTEVRGRSPISQFVFDQLDAAGSASMSSRVSTDERDLADGEREFVREYVPDGFVLRCDLLGVMDDSLTTTTGLSAQIVDEGDGTVYASTEQKRDSRNPPVKVFGPADVRLEAFNDSGGSVPSVSARFEYDVVSGNPPGLAVDTVSASNVTSDSADLTGDLRSLGQAASADVFHEYRETGASTFTATTKDTVSGPQQFTDSISGLNSGTEYEFRSAAGGSDGSSDQGVLLTFTTSGVQAQIIDDFEDNDMSEYTDFDTGTAETTTQKVQNGTYAMRIDDSHSVLSAAGDGLNYYPDPGDTIEFYINFDDTSSTSAFVWAVQGTQSYQSGNYYRLYVEAGGDKRLILQKNVDGTTTTLASTTGLSVTADVWYKCTVDWATNGDITATFDGSTTINANDTTFTDGGVGFSTFGSGGWTYFDNVRQI